MTNTRDNTAVFFNGQHFCLYEDYDYNIIKYQFKLTEMHLESRIFAKEI